MLFTKFYGNNPFLHDTIEMPHMWNMCVTSTIYVKSKIFWPLWSTSKATANKASWRLPRLQCVHINDFDFSSNILHYNKQSSIIYLRNAIQASRLHWLFRAFPNLGCWTDGHWALGDELVMQAWNKLPPQTLFLIIHLSRKCITVHCF